VADNRQADGLEGRFEKWASALPDTELRPETRRKVQAMLASSLTPVKPFPSQSRLVFTFLAVFTVCAVGLISILNKAGFHLITGAQMGLMAAILAGGGILLSFTLAWRMVPGSRWRLPFSLVLMLSGLATIAGIALLFPWHTTHAFVLEGWPCAALELTIAIPSTALYWLIARRGALFSSSGLGASLTALAVFLALMPVQFQCMFQQAPHLLIWHGGTALLLIGLGTLIGELARHLRAS
jgi:Negative regulator of sigma F